MKLTELMVGDYVKIRDTNKYLRIGGTNDMLFHDDYEPIPLTEEILVKNGYTIDECSTRELSSVFSSNIKLYSFPLGVGFHLEYDIEKNVCHLTDHWFIEIKYVHQLQHLLRMCGIEREITL